MSRPAPASGKLAFAFCIGLMALPSRAAGADWPQWRYDAGRTAGSPAELPAALALHWVREYPPLEPAWEDAVNRDRMPFDRVYEPVVAGRMMFVGSNSTDTLTALDTRTGRELWRFYAEGPVRLPPAAWAGRVYCASDDGYLYCLRARDGRLLWKFRGGPDARKVLGNSRLVSAWPARGGPVVADGLVYFGAGIWPFMGTFIYALSAETGEPVWTADGLGSIFMDQPHGGAVAFAGVAPQGALAAVGDRLIVPCGRSVPACLDRTSGELLYYHLAGSAYKDISGGPDRKREGGSHVCGIGDVYFNHRGINTTMYDLATGGAYKMWEMTTYPVLTEDVCYFSGDRVVAASLRGPMMVPDAGQLAELEAGRREYIDKGRWGLFKLWECDADATGALIRSGSRLYAGGHGVVSAIQLRGEEPPVLAWTARVEGSVARLIAADDRLFAVTLEGRIYAFGAGRRDVLTHRAEKAPSRVSDESARRARAILADSGVAAGYCLALGLSDGRLVEELARLSELRVVGVDPDAAKVDAIRRRLDRAGLYGRSVSLLCADADSFRPPPYMASLIVSETLSAADLAANPQSIPALYEPMRPYGGAAYIAGAGRAAELSRVVGELSLPGAEVSADGDYVVLRRSGPLPGSDDWTHQYGDVANTAKSSDELVRTPLGLLWFGGNTHEDVLPRHGHGPCEQVAGGRLFIEGVNRLSARDVYTGRRLWVRTFEGLGTDGVYYDGSYRQDPLDTTYNQVHIAGANARGTNFVAAPDAVYLIVGDRCLVLDPATGETVRTLELPPLPSGSSPDSWGYIGVWDDLLIAGSQFVRYSEKFGVKRSTWEDFDSSSSEALVVMDRWTGTVLWSRAAEYGFRHNAIAAGAGRLFCIDQMPGPILDALRRRGEDPPGGGGSLLTALAIRTGEPLWERKEGVFGTWLGYSEEHGVLVEAGRSSRDMLSGEPDDRIIAHRASDGTVIWDKPVHYSGPCMLHGDVVYFNARDNSGSAVELLSGEPLTRLHPLTGAEMLWTYGRAYGCNYVIASEHLLTFRSGAAGYYDLLSDGGTGNLGGFKSGCTSNLVVADGVLNAPDYTRTCTCSYQNQTSLALVHTPDVEEWTFNPYAWDGRPVVRVGLNLGAPGDRMASGTLWMDYPSVGGPSPDLPVRLGGEGHEWYRHHSSRVSGPLPWVCSSGAEGLTEMVVTLATETSGPALPYTVRLCFAEPQRDATDGGRVFDLALQGRLVAGSVDVCAEAGGPNRTLVREFTGVEVAGELAITLRPVRGRTLLCGVEIVAEE